MEQDLQINPFLETPKNGETKPAAKPPKPKDTQKLITDFTKPVTTLTTQIVRTENISKSVDYVKQ